MGLRVQIQPRAWKFPVSVVCCQVEAVRGGSIRRNPSECVCLSVLETSAMRRPGPIRVSSHRKVKCLCSILYCFISASS